MRASPALFNRFHAEHVDPSIEATKHPRKVQELSSTIVAMVPTVRVPGRGMASEHGKGTARGGAAAPQYDRHTPPLAVPSLSPLRCLGGLASPIADNRLDQSRGWKADYRLCVYIST